MTKLNKLYVNNEENYKLDHLKVDVFIKSLDRE